MYWSIDIKKGVVDEVIEFFGQRVRTCQGEST